jgi:hypothetical protein
MSCARHKAIPLIGLQNDATGRDAASASRFTILGLRRYALPLGDGREQ